MQANGYNVSIVLNNKIKEEYAGKRFYTIPENVLLYAMRKLSFPALRLYIVLIGQKDGFTGAMKTYCTRANIKVNNYSKYRDELIKKGFLEFEPYKQMTVKVPAEAYEEDYSVQGVIYVVKYDSQDKKNNSIEGEDLLTVQPTNFSDLI